MGKILDNKISYSERLKKEFNKYNNRVGVVTLTSPLSVKKDLRNKFIECGSINNPSKSYHLEMFYDNYKEAMFTYKELKSLGIKSSISTRTRGDVKKYITYIKSGEMIINFLKELGASKIYNIYLKSYNNKTLNQNVNRKVNFETSNIRKAANAGNEQINDIKKLLKKYRLKELDIKLQEVILARKKYPELSLIELSQNIGNISKSALNHRFKKIKELAYENTKKGGKK